MARITAPNITNTFVIEDKHSGTLMHLHFRTPTSSDRIKYRGMWMKRKGKKITASIAAARQHWGKIIFTGFDEGAFAKMVNDKEVPYASDPKSAHYDSNWKELVCEFASDLIEALAEHAFDSNTGSADEDEDEEEDKEDEGEDEDKKDTGDDDEEFKEKN